VKVKFYGVRGSLPICDPEFQEFGGNTTCILLKGTGNIGILDAGTGIRNLGNELITDPDVAIKAPVFIGFSHFHWDHIQGIPFFAPAYDPKRKFVFSAVGKGRHIKEMKDVFSGQMQSDYFPVSLDEMGAIFDFHHPDINSFKTSEATINAVKHNHPGNAYSYRIEDHLGKVLVFCTDIEHGEELDPKIVELARGADLLIHEGQYTPEELPAKKGWGHSSWEQAIGVAEQAGVKKLAITHHDPDHNDSFLLEVEKKCQARFPNSVLAREKMEIEI
jgi:phosphoribosyl 1,2-cyclic phosphodiesterase